MSEPLAVAFIGLGTMGFPMAGHLQRAGHHVSVFNRTGSKAEQWSEQYAGTVCQTPASAAIGAQFVVSCVGNDDDLESVMLGPDGVISVVAEGTVIVDHTTTSADVARSLAAAFADRGCGFIDAPVSGGQTGAEKGQLTVMCGGEDNDFERALPLLQAYAFQVKLLGGSGSGQLTKMVNQICVAGVIQGLAEGLHFARSAGLDIDDVMDVISKGAAQSWQMDNRSLSMKHGQYQHGFAVDWMRKDLAYVLTEARHNGSHLPLTAVVDQFFSEVQALGGGRWDISSLLARHEYMRAE